MDDDEADLLARKVIIAIVEAKMAAGAARAGRAPHISHLRALVEDLLPVDSAGPAGRSRHHPANSHISPP